MPTDAELLAAALAQQQAGQLDRAADAYRRLIEQCPGSAEGHNNLGNVLLDQGRPAEALASFDQAARLRPDAPEIHFNRGNCLQKLHRGQEAVAAYRQALALRPDFALAHNNLGLALQSAGELAAAADCHRRAIELAPDHVDAHLGLAMALQAQGRLDEAEASYRQALGLNPRHAYGWFCLGSLLRKQLRLGEAEQAYATSAQLSPGNAEARLNLAACLQVQGKFHDALAEFDKAIEIDPQYTSAHYYRSTLLLLLGQFEAGWREYEWRFQTRTAVTTRDEPRWSGQDLHGRRIVLHAEYGLGDTLHFLRYVPLVESRGGDVVLEVQQPLIPLLRQSGYQQLVPLGGAIAPPCDFQAPLLSLPGIFGTNLESIPARVPYMTADPTLVEQWRAKLQAYPGTKVGIAWRGSPVTDYEGRSIPLETFEPLARANDVTLISLQQNDGVEELESLGHRFRVVDLGDEVDTAHGAFMDTAAIMQHLDLVVSCDTATAHLAGALGVPVWVALLLAPDFRWLLDRDDTPWYPTMRLFRQTRVGDWGGVLSRMGDALRMDLHR